MILYPAIGDLMKNVDSRYTLVIETAKRARQLNNGSRQLVFAKSDKAVSVAVLEIAAGKVSYVRIRDGIK